MPAWIKVEGNHILYPMPISRNFCIGRNSDCDLSLDDPKTSRNHALIQHVVPDTYYLIDIASRNGCFVNGKRITTPKTLKNNDKIRIGDTYLEFVFEPEADKVIDPHETMISTLTVKELDIQEITILVADIRGFTTMTEDLPIESLSLIMNQWFMDVADCVSDNQGILDKFIGDAVYARWNTEQDRSEPIFHALTTACQLNDISKALNEQFKEIPFPLKIGVGINTGHAALDIGIENTAMGDAVNLAFRLEDQSKSIGKNIILSEASYQLLPVKPWDDAKQTIKVKGKKQHVDIVGANFDEVEQFLQNFNKINLIESENDQVENDH